MSFKLADRVVLITGASSGIGRACAIEFHRAGCFVVAAARSTDKLDALAMELGPDRAMPLTMDVTDAADRAAGIAAVRKRFGRIDVLINNAGWASFSSVMRMPEEHMHRMIALNLVAPIALTRAVLPEMIERASGQIINVSSVVGHQCIPRMTVYSATKAALTSFTTGLRMELVGSGVDVLLVAPGSTDTPFFDVAASVDVKTVRLAQHQYTPERVAKAVVRSSRRRRREVTLTAAGKLAVVVRRVSHRLADYAMYLYAKRGMPERRGSAQE
ncbi:MAG: SDR family NAD(P)-dependent oxidoreductase [Planctomycetes bacterium]|nr:SDR family NAD(P)-dependent oxidoreductase [Planctomycetota bacterium]